MGPRDNSQMAKPTRIAMPATNPARRRTRTRAARSIIARLNLTGGGLARSVLASSHETSSMPSALSSLSLYASLPPPADSKSAEVGLANWREAADSHQDPALATAMGGLATIEPGIKLLRSVFGNSPYLGQSCLKEPAYLLGLLERGHVASFATLMERLNRELDPGMARAELMDALRVEKRRAALLIALADLAGAWTLAEVTGALSAFADAALRLVMRHLL